MPKNEDPLNFTILASNESGEMVNERSQRVADNIKNSEEELHTFDDAMSGCYNGMTGFSLWIMGFIYLLYGKKRSYSLLVIVGLSLMAIGFFVEETLEMWTLALLSASTPFADQLRRKYFRKN